MRNRLALWYHRCLTDVSTTNLVRLWPLEYHVIPNLWPTICSFLWIFKIFIKIRENVRSRLKSEILIDLGEFRCLPIIAEDAAAFIVSSFFALTPAAWATFTIRPRKLLPSGTFFSIRPVATRITFNVPTTFNYFTEEIKRILFRSFRFNVNLNEESFHRRPKTYLQNWLEILKL